MKIKKILVRSIVLPVALIGAVLAISNREVIEIKLWPLPWSLNVPLFVALLAAMFVGALVGGAIVWLGGRRHRSAAREHRRESDRLRRQLGEARAAKTPVPGAALPSAVASPLTPPAAGTRPH